MAKRKLNYRFHNPNPVEVTADYILKVMIEANTEKVEKILRENTEIKMKSKVYNFVENCRNVNYNIKYEILSHKTIAKIKKRNIIRI